MTVGGIRAERMDPTDVVWLHMDRPTNLMVVNSVLWFDVPVDQASVLQLFQERVVWRFRRFRQRAADPALTLAPWADRDRARGRGRHPGGHGRRYGRIDRDQPVQPAGIQDPPHGRGGDRHPQLPAAHRGALAGAQQSIRTARTARHRPGHARDRGRRSRRAQTFVPAL
jgi:hypothetical protein